MKRSLLFFAIAILMSNSLLFASKDRQFENGYYLTLTGDTVKGLIRLDTKLKGTDTYISYKKSHKDKVKVVDPSSSKGFYLIDDQRTFISVEFPTQMGAWQFLEKVDDGFYTIYLTDLNIEGFTMANTLKHAKHLPGFNKYDHYTYDVPLMAVKTLDGNVVHFSTEWKKQLLELVKDNGELYNEVSTWQTINVYAIDKSQKGNYKEHDYYKMHSILVRYNLWKSEQK